MSATKVIMHPDYDMPGSSRWVRSLFIGVLPKRILVSAIAVYIYCATATANAQSMAVGAGMSASGAGVGMAASGSGELSAKSIPQAKGNRSTRSEDALVTLNVEAVPFQSGSLDAVAGLETAYQKVFGGDVSIMSHRDKHWQLVVRDAKTGEAIDGLGWGSNTKPVKYASVKDISQGETYTDSRWNASRPAVNPSTGREYEPKVMTYGEAMKVLQRAKDKSGMIVYSPYNNSNIGGAVVGTKDFFKSRQVVDNKAMMEWVAKNCQLWAAEVYLEIDKPTVEEWLKEKAESSNTSVSQPATELQSTTMVQPSSSPPTSGTVNLAPASQSCVIDNTAIKQWASQQLEDAYRSASGLAAEAGVGAEYQSAVAPVMSQGRAAINAIPDQQTITVPAQ